jgi:hypothetical protein
MGWNGKIRGTTLGASIGDKVRKKFVQNPKVRAAMTSSVVGAGRFLARVFLFSKIPSIDIFACLLNG